MARRRSRQTAANDTAAETDPVMAKVRRLRGRGNARRAMLFLRDACCRHADDARLWTHYGAQCASMGDIPEARRAYSHALWLRQRSRDQGRARSTRQLIDALDGPQINAA